MSDSVRPHRRQPTRLHCPYYSPGKNTGVGCHFLLQYSHSAAVAAKSLQSCPTLRDPIDSSPPGSDSPGKNTGVGCHLLLQCMKVKSKSEVTQSCPTLSDPMNCGPPGSSIHGIFQAKYWSGVPLPSPNQSSGKCKLKSQ